MVATFDALIFVAVLAIVSVSLISVQPSEPASPDASDVCDSLSMIRLDSDVLVGGSRVGNLSVWDACAVSMATDDTAFIMDYLQDVIDDVLTGRYGYEITIAYGDRSMSFGEGRGEPTSECSRSYDVLGGGAVQIRLTIF